MRFECKLKTQEEDPIAGNDLCPRIFGENAERKWKEFELYFSAADPRDPAPSKKNCPIIKFKVC